MDTQLLINIDVDDLDKAIQFYTAALGLRLQRHLFGGSVAEMVGATFTVHLLLKAAGTVPFASSRALREYGRHWTPVHLDFAVEDISSAVERAIKSGANLEQEITSYAWGHLATMSDPFGHGFCILQFVGHGYNTA